MAEIASAFVSLVPTAAGFGAATSRQINPQMDNAGKKGGGRFAAGLKAAIGPATALLGAAAVGGFLKDAIGEAREAQKVGALTESIIKATGGAAKVTAKDVGDLAGALSAKAGVDDEVIQQGANLLLTFKNVRNEAGKSNKVFDQATAAAVDLSAAGFGSVDGSAKMLGKALNDPIKGMSALGRAGVTFTDEQKELVKGFIAQGDTLSAQKVILKEVQGQVGGAAEASATAGEKLAVSWGNFKETIGTALLPLIDKLATFVGTKLLPGLLKLGPVVGQVAGFIKKLFSGFGSDTDGAGSKFAQFRVTVATVWASVKSIFTSAVSIVSALWGAFGGTLTTYAKAAFTNVMLVVRGAFTVIQGIFQVFSSLLKGDWQGVWDGIKKILSGAWQVIQGVVRQGWNLIQTAFRLAGTVIRGIFSGIWSGIKALAEAGMNKVVDAVRAIPGKLRDLGGKFKDAGAGLIGKLIEGIGNSAGFAADFASKIWDAVKAAINGGIDKLNGLLEFKIKIPGAPDVNVNAPNIGHLARGTDNWRGGPTWVGEKGPEILNLPRGSQVIPNHKTGAAMAGGAPTLNIYPQRGQSEQEIGNAAANRFMFAMS